jgi:hypothetical protein
MLNQSNKDKFDGKSEEEYRYELAIKILDLLARPESIRTKNLGFDKYLKEVQEKYPKLFQKSERSQEELEAAYNRVLGPNWQSPVPNEWLEAAYKKFSGAASSKRS